MQESERQRFIDASLNCIHCGLCLESCPTYRESGDEAESPRGRIYLMRALAEGRLEPAAYAALDSCVGCRACESACPSSVRYGDLLETARAAYVEPTRPAGLRTRFWRPLIRQVLPYRERFAVLAGSAQLIKRLGLAGGLPQPLRRAISALPDAQPAEPLPEWTPAVGTERGVVALLAGCAMPVLYAGVNAATVRMLARAGYRVWVPRTQHCCGAVSAHDGDRERAKALARANVAAFERESLVAVVSNAAGCGAALKHYGELLADEPEWAARAAAIAARTRDLSEVLFEAGLPAPARGLEAIVTYHDPCHLAHGQRVREAPRALLRAIPGIRFVELPEADWCCGGAGSYTLLQPDLSERLLAHKLENLRATAAQIVVTANPPCLMQIGMGLKREPNAPQLLHLAELLDRVYASL